MSCTGSLLPAREGIKGTRRIMKKDDFEIIDLDNTSEFFFDTEDTSPIRIPEGPDADDLSAAAELAEQIDEQTEDLPIGDELVQPVRKRTVRTNRYADAMYEEAPVREPKKPAPRRAEERKSVKHGASSHKAEEHKPVKHSPSSHKAEQQRPVKHTHAPHHEESYKAKQHKPVRSEREAYRTADRTDRPGRRVDSDRRRPESARRTDSVRRDPRRDRRTGSSGGGGSWFRNLSGLDYLVAVTGVAVLIVAIVVVNMYSNARTLDDKIAAFASIGDELSGVGTAGEGILYAMADGRELTVSDEEEDDIPVIPEYDEKEDAESGTVNVVINLQSVVKDLKIKFVNKKTGKLIAGIAFKADVTDANKKTTTYTDDDKDGVIYIAKMQHGEAKVKLVALDGYPNYKFDSSEQKINVKETLEYKKIDVTDEIKKESQVNVAAEDTAQQTQVEAVLTDTVEWVESTKTPTGTETTYKEVKASEIAKPETVSGIDKIDYIYYRYVQYTGNTWVPVVHAEEDDEEGVTEGAAPTETETETESESESESKSEEQSETETETEAPPTQEPTKEVKPTPSPSPKVTSAPTEAPAPVATPTPTKGGKKGATPTPAKVTTPTTKPTAQAKDKKAALKTTKGEKLYIKSGDKYVAATAADYIKDPKQKFYKQSKEATGYTYTGWQVIEGSTFFFDKNGNKVTGEQVIQGAKYTFNSDGVLQAGSGSLGIDVSKWNGAIDWTKVRNSGISYVIIRCGYRGSTTGALIEDPNFRSNIKGATAAGLKVGVYFFTQATNEVEAVEEASMTLNLISGYKINYPVFLDVEGSGGRGDAIDSGTRTAVINAYCKTIANSGYSSGVYANKTWLSEKFNPGSLGGAKIWLAQYNTAPTYGGRYNMWQYTSKGKVSGISGNVDMNLSYMGY